MSEAATSGLRERREQLGLTLEQVSGDTRIPVAALVAIEGGQLEALPDGPYRAGFVRTYRKHLGLPVDPTPAPVPRTSAPNSRTPAPAKRTPPAVRPRTPIPVVRTEAEADVAPPPVPQKTLPLWLVRGVAAIACLGLISAIAWQLQGLEFPTEEAPVADEFDQRISLVAKRDFLLKIEVDGEWIVDRKVAEDETFDLAGKDQITVHLPTADAAKIVYNGQSIVPQGRQDEPRVLKFIDDRAKAP